MIQWIIDFIERLFKGNEPVKPAPIPEVVPPVEEPSVEPPKVKTITDFYFVDSSHHHPDFNPVEYKKAFTTGTPPILSNKCTQGTGFVDKTHAIRKKLCAEHGILYSGYHFYECFKDPIAQAKHYVDTHGPFGKFPPQVDFEVLKNGQTEDDLYKDKEDLYLMLCEVEKLTGMTPWLYLNWGAASRLKFDKRFGRFTAWFARYNSYLGPIPFPWTEETTGAWQYTEEGKFAGFKGGNDVNVYYGKVNVLGLE